MANASTPHRTGWSAEEIGFLAGGPRRAAETAFARLMDGGLVRVSREGLVTAVYQNGYGATTALEANILNGLHSGARSIASVVQPAAHSQEMASLRQGLVDKTLVRRQWGKARGYRQAFRLLLFLLTVATAFVAVVVDMKLLAFTAMLLFLVILMRDKGMLTPFGRAALKHATSNTRSRVDAVALRGLHGMMGRQRVSDMFGLPAHLIHLPPVHHHGRSKSSSDGGGCSSSYDYSHSCGSSSSCSSSSCSSSSSSCSSSSSSSCSSSSSSSCSSSSS